MGRLYASENFPLPVVEELRRLGHEVVTIQETGKAEQRTPDEEVLQLAVADDRAVLTLNRKHFVRLHAERPEHASFPARCWRWRRPAAPGPSTRGGPVEGHRHWS